MSPEPLITTVTVLTPAQYRRVVTRKRVAGAITAAMFTTALLVPSPAHHIAHAWAAVVAAALP